MCESKRERERNEYYDGTILQLSRKIDVNGIPRYLGPRKNTIEELENDVLC